MAVHTEPRGKAEVRPPASGFLVWIRRAATPVSRSLFAILLAILAGAVVILLTSKGSVFDRIGSVGSAYGSLWTGSFGDPQFITYTLVKVTPLILAGLSVAIAFRAGLFNIGTAGQIAVGATTAAIFGLKLTFLPAPVLITLMIVASMLAGGIWGGIVGLLKAWRGAHEVVTTIMLNWIAFNVTDYLINGPLKAPNQANQTPSLASNATLPLVSVFYNNTLGRVLPPISQPEQYTVDTGIFLALAALLVYWFLTMRTTFGYNLRVIGQNPQAARYAGISLKRHLFLAMALAGAFGGLAGAVSLMGQFPNQLIATTFSTDPTGFDAIGVALIGRTSAIGVLFGSLLFGGLRQGGTYMQLNANVPGDLVYILQALMLFSIAAEFLVSIQRSATGLLARRPSLTTPVTGADAVQEPVVEDVPEQASEDQTDGVVESRPIAEIEGAGVTNANDSVGDEPRRGR